MVNGLYGGDAIFVVIESVEANPPRVRHVPQSLCRSLFC
jgi:hypothetical protein